MEVAALKLEIVKPKPWDAAGLVALVLAMVVTGANFAASSNSASQISGSATLIFATVQMALCLFCFLVLGKTASQGTIWGNLLSLAASFAAGSGVLLSVALWALA